jgi:hypothetical protein
MQVTINRNFCGHPPASCEACFGEFLRKGAVPDRGCIVDVQDDGKPEVIATIVSGKYRGTLVVDDQNRDAIIAEGWMKFANLPPEAFDIVPPHGDDVRRMIREQETKNR